ncbi:Hypothetical_protein [Hexamita inflata]|uniref:Hypothetical_protein n=1 Tax=Hexamita inflata TaxID=28002 RepID=A0ABP1HMX3_9EUKA
MLEKSKKLARIITTKLTKNTKPDISFIKDGKQQFFDISWDTERYFAVKQKHYQTETVNGQPITCTPIIIGKDTTVHPAALRQVGIEDSWLYHVIPVSWNPNVQLQRANRLCFQEKDQRKTQAKKPRQKSQVQLRSKPR